MRSTSYVLTIIHKDPDVQVKREIDQQKDASSFRTDGKESVSRTQCCGEVTAIALWEGSALVRQSKFGTSTMDDKWTVSQDGREFTIVRRLDQNGAVRNEKLVLVRKQ